MRDINGIDITVRNLSRYLGEGGYNHIVRILNRKGNHTLPIDPNYLLTLQEIQYISPEIYFQVSRNTFRFPDVFHINIQEVEEALQLKVGKMYYSPITNHYYFYRGWNASYYIKEFKEFKFYFEVSSTCNLIIRKSPFGYGQSRDIGLLVGMIEGLQLVPYDGVYIDVGDCFYSPDHKQFLIYTYKGRINYYYYFENPFYNEIKLTDIEIRNLLRVEIKCFYALRKSHISRYQISERGEVEIFCNVVTGHYRGEDSGAIYPEFEEECQSVYDLAPLFMQFQIRNDLVINDKIAHLLDYNPHYNDLYELLCFHPELCISGYPIYSPPEIPV